MMVVPKWGRIPCWPSLGVPPAKPFVYVADTTPHFCPAASWQRPMAFAKSWAVPVSMRLPSHTGVLSTLPSPSSSQLLPGMS